MRAESGVVECGAGTKTERSTMTKQGRADHSNVSATKREPIAHAIDPGGAAQIGTMVAKNPTPLNDGRGFMSPEPKAVTTHHCGSQGKHT